MGAPQVTLTDSTVDVTIDDSTVTLEIIDNEVTVDFVDGINAISQATDTSLSGLATGDLLVYNSTTGKWENKTESSVGHLELDGSTEMSGIFKTSVGTFESSVADTVTGFELNTTVAHTSGLLLDLQLEGTSLFNVDYTGLKTTYGNSAGGLAGSIEFVAGGFFDAQSKIVLSNNGFPGVLPIDSFTLDPYKGVIQSDNANSFNLGTLGTYTGGLFLNQIESTGCIVFQLNNVNKVAITDTAFASLGSGVNIGTSDLSWGRLYTNKGISVGAADTQNSVQLTYENNVNDTTGTPADKVAHTIIASNVANGGLTRAGSRVLKLVNGTTNIADWDKDGNQFLLGNLACVDANLSGTYKTSSGLFDSSVASGGTGFKFETDNSFTSGNIFQVLDNGSPAFTISHSLASKFSGNCEILDSSRFFFGNGFDYWFGYDDTEGAPNEFSLYHTNVDGIGTNGSVFTVTDGSADIVFSADVSCVDATISNDLNLANDSEILFGTSVSPDFRLIRISNVAVPFGPFNLAKLRIGEATDCFELDPTVGQINIENSVNDYISIAIAGAEKFRIGSTQFATFASGIDLGSGAFPWVNSYFNGKLKWVGSAITSHLASNYNDSASGAGNAFKLNAEISMTVAGSKLLSVQNNSVEKAYIDKDGIGSFSGGIAVQDFVPVTGTAFGVDTTFTGSGTTNAVSISATASPTNIGAGTISLDLNTTVTPQNTFQWADGINATVYHNGAVQSTFIRGLYLSVGSLGVAGATDVFGINVNALFSGTGVISTCNGVTVTNMGDALVTSAYGVRISKQQNATNNYGIHLNGDDLGSDICFGAGHDVSQHFNGTVLEFEGSGIAHTATPVTNDGYVQIAINGVTHKFMTGI